MVKDAIATYPVFPFLTLRFGSATLVLLLLGWKRLFSIGWRGLGAGVLVGLFLFAGYAFQTMGLRHTSASKAAFITGLNVALVPLLSALMLGRAPKTASLLGVCLATTGLALLTLTEQFGIGRGDLLVLFCALSFALHIVSIGAFATKMDVLAFTIIQLATVTVASLIAGLLGNASWASPTPSTWFAAGFTGILGTAAAFAIQTSMQRFTSPTHTALIFTGEPVFAALFGALIANEVLTMRNIAGGILIIAGTVLSEIRWSEKTAAIISRFLGPHYVAGLLLLILGLADPFSQKRGVVWAIGLGLLSVCVPLVLMTRELRLGRISDWHISNRKERLGLVPVLISITAPGIPLLILWAFNGPELLLAAFLTSLVISSLSLLVTLWWKISQHVTSIAASTTFITAVLGIGASPILLLIPLVAWARVKVGAHTIMQTIVGGVAGSITTLAALYFFGII